MRSDSHSPSNHRENRENRETRREDSYRRSPTEKYKRERDASSSPENRGSFEKNSNTNPSSQGNVLYVTNLNSKIKERQLEDKFKAFGSLQSINLVKDPYSKESRGFAFITFNNVKDADEALDALNGLELEGRKIRVEKAKRNKPREKTPGRYLGHYKPRNNEDGSSFNRDRDRDRDRKYRRDRSRSRSRSNRRRSRSRSQNRRPSHRYNKYNRSRS